MEFGEITYLGDVHNCTAGAYNLFEQHQRTGSIIVFHMHTYFIPRDASQEEIAMNLGRLVDFDGEIIEPVIEPITIATLRLLVEENVAYDVTQQLVENFDCGRWVVE